MKILKKIIAFTIVGMMILSFPIVNVKEANAAMTVSKVTNSTNIDSKYSFSIKYISGVTKLETFGGSSYTSDLWTTEGGITISSGSKSIRLTSSTQKGKIGAWYRNVGEYKGEMLDLKITIVDWKELHKPVDIDVDGVTKKSYPCVIFSGQQISISTVDKMIKSPKFRFEYFNQDGELVKAAGHQTFKDIDLTQYIESSDFTKGYLSSDTQLHVSGNKVYSGETKDMASTNKQYWFTGIFSDLSSYDMTFGVQATDDFNFDTSKLSYRGIDTFTLSGDSLAPFTTPEPIKKATRYVHKGRTVKYNITFTVPLQPSEFKYSKFVLSDTLPKGIKYNSFKVTNDEGDNVTNLFNATINGQDFKATVVTPSSNSFMYKSYNLELTCTADSNFDFSSLNNNGGKVEVSNTATITSKVGSRAESSKTSNEALTEVRFLIDTATDGNGKITESLDNVIGGSDKTISYNPNAGYKVNTITVDGKKVNVSNNKENYLFKDIYDNHDIKVTFTPTTDNKITITKKIPEKDVYTSFGKPVSIIKLTGTDLNGNDHSYFRVIELTKDNLKDGYYQKSVTFNNLTAGNYKAEEIDLSRYSLSKIEGLSGASSADDKISFDLVNNKSAKGTFVNTLNNYEKFSHNDVITNQFN